MSGKIEKPVELRDLPDPDNCDHMTMEAFVETCQFGGFIDDDGFGYYATEHQTTNRVINPSDVARNKYDSEYTHVVWFNK